MLDWISVTSYIEITKENKDRLLKAIKELKEMNALSEDNYQSLIEASKIFL